MKLAVAITSGMLMLIGSSSAWATCDPKQSGLIPTSRYEINGGEVYDTKTNLTWQRCSYGQHWKDGGCTGVVQIVTGGQLGVFAPKGISDWRVPTTDELKTLVSPPCTFPSINEEAFPNMDVRRLRYWTYDYDRSAPFEVDFRLGQSQVEGNQTGHIDKTTALRLVRVGR